MTVSAEVSGLFDRIGATWAPPPDLTVSEFCDRELVVTAGPLAGTRWQTDFAPYQRGIMDAFSEPGVEFVACRMSSQVGKTAMALGVVAYHMAHDPCPILVVEPTVEPMARDFARNRLEPLIAASPVLSETVARKRSRDSSNTILAKTFKGGFLTVGGANSAASLAARSVRLLILDEIDRYPPELPGEGSTIRVALKRTISFRGRRRVMLLSSPTLKGAPIDAYFERGDQRRYYVPCPRCGFMHKFEWRNVRWKGADASSARLHCPSCDYGLDEAERLGVLDDGEWRAEAKARRANTVSFHLWEAYSPVSSLAEIVTDFLDARRDQKAGDNGTMHAWQNTTLGEPIEPETGEGVEWELVLQRAEPYPAPAPEGVCCLTVGIDTQDDRLELLVLGWGVGEEAWVVDRQRLTGDTSQPAVWDTLSRFLTRTYEHEGGRRLEILAGCIDSAGHRTQEVYNWVSGQARRARRIFATIGRPGQRPIVSAPSPRHWGRKPRPVDLYTVGVDAAKALLMSRLELAAPGPGYVHLPEADWADEDLAKQLTSERLVTRYSKGVPVQEWRILKLGQRNEMLDCFVLATAALRLARVDLKLLAERLSRPLRDLARRRPPRRPASDLDVPDDWLDR